MNTISTIILSLGGSTVIAGALIKWSSSLLTSRITMSWDQSNKKELELIKANLQSNQEVVKLAVSSLTSNNQKLLEKQLVAAEDIWKHILELRECSSSARRYYSILEPEHYNLPDPDRETLLESFQYKKLDHVRLGELVIAHEKLETYRPYLGRIWSLYCLYRAFIIRMVFKFDDDYEEGNILPWYTDESLLNMVKGSLGALFEQINLTSRQSINQVIIILETEILSEIDELISGQSSTEKNFKEARRLMELASKEYSDLEQLKTKQRVEGLPMI